MPTSTEITRAVKLPKLDVLFEGGVHMEWPKPPEYTCLSFSCLNLPKTNFVAWWDVPLHKTATFFETTDCTYKSNSYSFNTGSTTSAVTGMYFFSDGAKPIRSVMLGWTEGVELNEEEEKKKKTTKVKIKRSCNLKKTDGWM
ncbi:hypothetical protein V7S43_007903 [Phytophthora oleae]|uniref:Uncharacterized protein n=1 Tax=Phytophthora oleae TaxID=2107226 RepID=A0ABD3FMJ3_9STRA